MVDFARTIGVRVLLQSSLITTNSIIKKGGDMKLRGINFGPVWDASGTQGFFGEGYPYHKVFRCIGLDFTGSTFVAKTMTLEPRKGNMRLRSDGTFPWWEGKPKCIVVRPLQGVVLNAVGLSNPGAEALFRQKKWQKRWKPFFLSFMAVKEKKEERLRELREFVYVFRRYMPEFSAPVGLQLNYSCPNVGLHVDELIEEVYEGLSIAGKLNIPLVPKFNALLPVSAAVKIAKHPSCDALCVSNTIPWGKLPERIDWQGIFGTAASPLAEFGGGGLSGAPLLPIVIQWVKDACASSVEKPINAGGGILRSHDIDALFSAGSSSVSIGSIAMLRPWRVQKTIRHARGAFR